MGTTLSWARERRTAGWKERRCALCVCVCVWLPWSSSKYPRLALRISWTPPHRISTESPLPHASGNLPNLPARLGILFLLSLQPQQPPCPTLAMTMEVLVATHMSECACPMHPPSAPNPLTHIQPSLSSSFEDTTMGMVLPLFSHHLPPNLFH